MRRFFAPLAPLLAAAFAACPTDSSPDAAGDWGGEHARLTVGAATSAVEFDCAHGTIDVPLRPDSDGRFSVMGTYTREHGGPIREGEAADTHPARYTGRIVDGTMSLGVTILDTSGISAGVIYTLRHGVAAHVFKCL